jgi:5-methylcytosine-specific restriction endonuclease McrA
MGTNLEWAKNNRDRYAQYAANQRDKLKLEMVTAYGGCCKDCGEIDPIVLSLDHINDDAYIEKELYGENARGGHKQYARLKREGWPQERFQLLCFNCNAKKEHKRRRDGIAERWGKFEKVDPAHRSAKMKVPAHNTSGIKGVFWNSQKSKWAASIMIDYKAVHLGFFSDIADAARAYATKAKEVWGENANVATEEEIAEAADYHSKPKQISMNAEELGL